MLTTWALGIAAAAMLASDSSPIQSDEMVVFFPTAAWYDAVADAWEIPIHGWIFEPETNSRKRAFARRLLKRILDLEPTEAEQVTYTARASAFLVDNESGKEISILLGGESYELEESAANGHFYGRISLPAAKVDSLLLPPQGPSRWLSFAAVTKADDKRVFSGYVAMIEPEGISVISDIDDTIKVTGVQDREALLRNTFLRSFQPVPGMAEVYNDWADAGAVFHYVSGSPWQLYIPMALFCEESGFPRGTFHMKLFRLVETGPSALWASPEELKTMAIEPLLQSYPGRTFVCVGDSAERDPEIYGALARRYGDRIRAVCIRNVTGESADGDRMQRAFEGLPRHQWQLFDDPRDLAELIPPPATH